MNDELGLNFSLSLKHVGRYSKIYELYARRSEIMIMNAIIEIPWEYANVGYSQILIIILYQELISFHILKVNSSSLFFQ